MAMMSFHEFTTTNHHGRRFLIVPVAVVQDAATPDDARWCAHVCDPASPLAGLYAFAGSLDAVRDAVAQTAWAAVTAGELAAFDVTAATFAGVYVVATTCDVYDAADLAVALANDAA
jgi:hypothetical protein